jgi:hypothetical protein
MQVGVFYPNSAVTLNQIIDGTSHTIMIGEMQRLQDPGGVVPAGQNPEYYAPCLTSSDGWAVAGLSTLFDTDTADGYDGCNKVPGSQQRGGFNEPFFEAAGSDHPGGANFAAVDASVHFLNESMDPIVYGLLGSMADGGYYNLVTPATGPTVVSFPQ